MSTATMPGVVHYALRKHAVELREVPVPQIGDDDVLLAVRAVSVCGSDVHQYQGTHSWQVNTPVILGHEFCGVVAKAGRNVRSFKEGDRVVSETAARICGECALCRSGEYNLCPKRLGFGYGVNGGMAQFVATPARCLHRLPDALPFERAALTEPCSVAYNAVCVKTRIKPGDFVVVLGPGPIGLLCLEMARLSGAGLVASVGIGADAKRLEAARQLGADIIINGEERGAVAAVREQGDGFGADVIIDAVGASGTIKQAMEMVRPAGQITKVGWGPQPMDFPIDPLVAKAATLQGSFSHNYRTWEAVIRLLAARKINLDPILSRVAPLNAWRECMEAMHGGEMVKAVLKPL
jgi:alcohol dehydrogenase/L-iditol 2-dehydrogenase